MMRFGAVRGKTPIFSGGVQSWTHSPYSHWNILWPDCVYEAEPQGFGKFASLSVNNAGCQCDVLQYREQFSLNDDEEQIARTVCDSMVGIPYGFDDLFKFLNITGVASPETPKTLMCSGAGLALTIRLSQLIQRDVMLLSRVTPDKVSPRDLFMSPLLEFSETILIP